jgi:hypothetical protein
MVSMMRKLLWLSLLLNGLAVAAPSHFPIVIGSALVCRDQVSSDYFNDYMLTYFGAPAFNAGGANWWKVNESIFNTPVEYVFVGVGMDFIGATFKVSPVALVSSVKDAIGVEYKQVNGEKWVSTSYGVLLTYHDRTTPSKMYCFGYPHTPL